MEEQQHEFDWDKAKAASNLIKHGIRFEMAISVFTAERRHDVDTTRADQNETRRKSVAPVEGRLLAVVYTTRNEKIRIISARPANARETAQYRDIRS